MGSDRGPLLVLSASAKVSIFLEASALSRLEASTGALELVDAQLIDELAYFLYSKQPQQPHEKSLENFTSGFAIAYSSKQDISWENMQNPPLSLLAGISAPGSGQLAMHVGPSTARKCRRVYHYSPLDETKNEIRIFRLYCGKATEEFVEGKLDITELHNNQPRNYKALSYE